MGYVEESQAAGRHILPDLARAFALIGIVLVNVALLAYPMMTGYAESGLATSVDKAAFFSVNALFTMKSYTLFSFMFGVGFAYQMSSAEKRGAGFAGRYWRRILGLLVLGVLHVAFLFQGDILVVYAILGSILFMFRNLSAKNLKIWAILLYSVQVVLMVIFSLIMFAAMKMVPELMTEEIAKMDVGIEKAQQVFGQGTFIEAMALRLTEWGEIVILGTLLTGLGALSFFLFGLLAVRNGVIANPSAPIWKKFRRVYLPIGLIGSAWGAWLMMSAESQMDPQMMYASTVLFLFAPFSTAGYLGLIAKWAAGPMTRLKTFMARGGTASLTAYLMQGLLLSFVFNNYGLGLYEKIGAASCIGIALIVGLITLTFSSLWRTKFKRGPMEFLLRKWTYLGGS